MEHLGGRQKVAHEEKMSEKLAKKKVMNSFQAAGGIDAALSIDADSANNGNSHHYVPLHDLAGLTCDDHGGPHQASEMVYWQDIPSDAAFRSPIGGSAIDGGRRKYLTFEPDGKLLGSVELSLICFWAHTSLLCRCVCAYHLMLKIEGHMILTKLKNDPKHNNLYI